MPQRKSNRGLFVAFFNYFSSYLPNPTSSPLLMGLLIGLRRSRFSGLGRRSPHSRNLNKPTVQWMPPLDYPWCSAQVRTSRGYRFFRLAFFFFVCRPSVGRSAVYRTDRTDKAVRLVPSGLGLRPARMFGNLFRFSLLLSSVSCSFLSCLPLYSVFRFLCFFCCICSCYYFAADDRGRDATPRYYRSLACWYCGAPAVLCLFVLFDRDASFSLFL